MRRLQFIALCLAIVFWGCSHRARGGSDSTNVLDPGTAGVASDTNLPHEEQKLIEENLQNEGWTSAELNPVFFDYDRSDIRRDQTATLERDAHWMLQHPDAKVLIEGHCDERGTEEYNLALGDRRATVTRDYLMSLGIAERRMNTVTYGESRPFVTDHDEEAWRQNRRAQFLQLKE